MLSYRVKTKVQQRALAGERYRGVIETLTRLIRGEFIIPTFMITIKNIIPSQSPSCVYAPAFLSFHPVFRIRSPVRNHEETLIPALAFVPGPDPQNPKPLVAGIGRLYRGLGVSAVRSVTTHGLLWTFFDLVSNYIDRLPVR